MSKGVQIATGATVIALLLAWMGSSNFETIAYYQNLADFRVQLDSQIGKAARVHGYVVTGSIRRDLPGKQVLFHVQNDPPHAAGNADSTLRVVFAGLETPDLFKDGAEVVIEGKLRAQTDGSVFHADKVMAKCPSKFEGQATEPAPF